MDHRSAISLLAHSTQILSVSPLLGLASGTALPSGGSQSTLAVGMESGERYAQQMDTLGLEERHPEERALLSLPGGRGTPGTSSRGATLESGLASQIASSQLDSHVERKGIWREGRLHELSRDRTNTRYPGQSLRTGRTVGSRGVGR